MNILFSLTYYTPYVSGLTLYIKRLAEAFIKRGYQVSVVTMQFDKNLKLSEIINGVKVNRAIPIFKISKGFISWDFLVKSWNEVKKTDVLVISLPQFEGLIPAFLGKLFGKKVISIYHCEVVLPRGIMNNLIEWLMSLGHFVTLSLSDSVITYTEDFAVHSKILPFFKTKLRYIYPPIIEPKVTKRVQKILSDKITRPYYFVIGIAARLAAEKGIEYVLESIPAIKSKIKNQKSKIQFKSQNYQKAVKTPRGWPNGLPRGGGIKIVIAGSLEPVGEENYKRKILSLVAKYKDYVVFLGELKEEDMGSFYSLIDILVLPSVNSTEAFGMVQVEAMMMGVPVVATNLPGVRIPIQKTGMGIIVPIRNSQKLAEGVIEVLLNKKKYIKDKETIKREFSIEKTIEFYEKLLSHV